MKKRAKKLSPVERFLARHHKGCLKVSIFSEKHPCTCGRDEAEKAFNLLMETIKVLHEEPNKAAA